MYNYIFGLFLVCCSLGACNQPNNAAQNLSANSSAFIVDGQEFIINGMNWNYIPIGKNYEYSLWNQSEATIKAALKNEMTLLNDIGVNSIRQYTGVPAKWIKYIYEKYGIYTMLNHSFGRYGLTINETWTPNTDYANTDTKILLLAEIKTLATQYKNTPGLLMYLIGNENNYGLSWQGAETESIPSEKSVSDDKVRSMYKLFNKATLAIKTIDQTTPVAICNGDLSHLDIIAEECKDIDIFGTNIYRGLSFDNAFQTIKEKLNKPVVFTEFGADAFNAILNKEDQKTQAKYLINNWKEIYQNTSTQNKSGNAIGGFTFQFSDGWWKYGQKLNLDKHDNNASWKNGGYSEDYVDGKNNMNEEWFGVCGKGPANEEGLYKLYPREAYYALKKIHQLNPYAKGIAGKEIEAHFEKIQFP
jgi:hypothetical protein